MRVGSTSAYPLARPAPRPMIRAGALRSGFHEPHPAWGYPGGRIVAPPPPGFVPERVERMESTLTEITLADTIADIITFSGTPDKIVVHARTNHALVTFTDTENRESHEVIADTQTEVVVYLPRRKVRARNLVAASNAVIFVTGYWLAPAWQYDAR